MIIYPTTKTQERFGIQLSNDIGQEILLKWGCKIFYHQGRKCLQVINFKTKFTLFLFDVRKDDMRNLDTIIKTEVIELFKDNIEVLRALKPLYDSDNTLFFSKLTDKSAISQLNRNEIDFLDVMLPLLGSSETPESLNYKFNFKFLVSRKEGKKLVYYSPAEYFREIVLA